MHSPLFSQDLHASRNERGVQSVTANDLKRLPEVEAYDVLEEQTLVGIGAADIAVPKARLVIETKTPREPCGSDEPEQNHGTQLKQLSNYVSEFVQVEADDLFTHHSSRRTWTGILTNGNT